MKANYRFKAIYTILGIIVLMLVVVFQLRKFSRSGKQIPLESIELTQSLFGKSQSESVVRPLQSGNSNVTASKEIFESRDLPVASVGYKILSENPPLMDTQILHRALLKRDTVVKNAQLHLSNPLLIEQWANSLNSLPNIELYLIILERAYIIDAFEEAVIWKENPERELVLGKIKEIVEAIPPENASLAQLKAIAVEKREIWQIIQSNFSEGERELIEDKKLELAWNSRISKLTKELQ